MQFIHNQYLFIKTEQMIAVIRTIIRSSQALSSSAVLIAPWEKARKFDKSNPSGRSPPKQKPYFHICSNNSVQKKQSHIFLCERSYNLPLLTDALYKSFSGCFYD
jgi:hypothetical protein